LLDSLLQERYISGGGGVQNLHNNMGGV